MAYEQTWNDLAVAICTVGRPECLQRALAALARQTVRPGVVLIVADGQHAAEVSEPAVRWCAADLPVRLVRSEGGLVPARRAAWRLAAGRCEVLLYIDDDTVLADDALEELRGVFAADKARAIAAATANITEPGRSGVVARLYKAVLDGSGWYRLKGRFAALKPWPAHLSRRGRIRPTPRLSGAAMALRASVLQRCQFDERLGRYASGEDVDLSLQAARWGYLVRADRVRALHAVADGGRPAGRRWGRQVSRNYFRIVERRIGWNPGTVPIAVGGWLAAVALHFGLAVGARSGAQAAAALGMIQGAIEWLTGRPEP